LNERSLHYLYENINFIKNSIQESNYYNAKNKIAFPWTKWYTLKKPKVHFVIDGEKMEDIYSNFDPSQFEKEADDCFSFVPEGFNKVIWTYSKKYSPNGLVCNGIVIPGTYSFSGLERGLPVTKPKVLIFDSNAKLNLSLNRNSLLNNHLPFEKDLLIEIYKDVIANILSFKPKAGYEGSKLKIVEDEIRNPSVYITNYASHKTCILKFVYLKEGFTLNNDYCLARISHLKQIQTLIVYDITVAEIVFSLFDAVTLVFKKNETIGELSTDLDPFNGGAITTTESIYQRMFNPSQKTFRIRRGLKSGHKILEHGDGLITYSYEYNKMTPHSHADMETIMKTVSVIAEKSIRDSYEDNLFNVMLKKYLGDDVVIPYDFKKRKEKFQEAFFDLDALIIKHV
jgi:molecular chaperone HtpG